MKIPSVTACPNLPWSMMSTAGMDAVAKPQHAALAVRSASNADFPLFGRIRTDSAYEEIPSSPPPTSPPIFSPDMPAICQQQKTRALQRPLQIVLVFAWGFSNISLLLTNRYLLMRASFQQPVFLTLCHMGASCLVPAVLATFQAAPAVSLTRRQLGGIAALAVVFSASVIMGNMSLRWVPVSFFQAIGATTPAFVAALAFLLLRQRESWGVYAALVPVMVGLVIATGAEPSFNAIGFAATIGATMLRALKTVMQGMLLKDVEPTTMLRHMAFFAMLCLLGATAVLEGDVLSRLPPVSDAAFYMALLLNCLLAMASNLLNIIVTKACGALSLQVFGNAFGVVATCVSVAIFRNPVSPIGAMGYGVSVCGVLLFLREKSRGPPAHSVQGLPSAGNLKV